MATSRKTQILLGLLAGLAVGGMGAGFVAGIASYAALKSEERRVQRGWNLVPVVVATRAVAPGEKLAFEAMSQRTVPEQFATSSVVKPDSAAYVKDQLLLAPLNSGDPLHWGMFLTTRPMPGPGPNWRGSHEVWEACDAALAARPNAPPRERTPADVRARLQREAQR